MDMQKYRDSLIERAAVAFARDSLDEAEYEAFVVRVQAASGEPELKEIEASMAPLEPAVSEDSALEDVREFSLNMGNLKKQGDWVDARAYRLEGRMSNFELDYRAYAGAPDFSMKLDVDLSMSNLKLLVPPDWQVDCRITRNTGSNIKDGGPFPSRGPSRIVIEGEMSMSNIKVKRRGRRRGLLALLFGR